MQAIAMSKHEEA